MDLLQVHLHCLADPVYFEGPQRIRDEKTRWTPPPVGNGTRIEDEGVWVRVSFGRRLPSQGWKIHVSAAADAAQTILDTAAAICTRHRAAFKYLRSAQLLAAFNSKYSHRGSSGKFITIYPADDGELRELLADLATGLEGQRGPYILSDLRWNDTSPVFIRYGGYTARWTTGPADEPVPAIARPDGALVPDLRTAAFTLPDWAPVPDFVQDRIAEFAAVSRADLPYEIVKPLHFSNGGGVYLAKDRTSGEPVVLKEARPLAGLDAEGLDAVVRLRRERDMLLALAGTGLVPRVLGYEVYWEHHFLIQEYVEGDPLGKMTVLRQPLVRPDATDGDYAEYTSWTLDVIDRVDKAVAVVHKTGIVFGDLHPHNIIIRPDGSVAFVDLEAAHPIGSPRTGLLGAPGYAAPRHVTGTEIDGYGLAALRVGQFVPLCAMASVVPDKPTQIARWAHERFPLPTGYATRAAAVMRTIAGVTAVASEPGLASHTWEANRELLTAAITNSSTPDRTDRLFPNDPGGSREGGGIGLSHGAAGVLYALHATGHAVDPAWGDWLVAAAGRTAALAPAGLFNGLCGVATVLDLLGRRSHAASIMSQAIARTGELSSLSLLTGLPGAGLAALGFHGRSGDSGYLEQACQIADRTEAALTRPGDESVTPGAGWATGAAGAALFLTRLYERTGDGGYLDLAAQAVRRDLGRCADFNGSLQVNDGWRAVTYLGSGSIGIGLALAAYTRHRTDAEFSGALAGIRKAARNQFTIFPGLLHGRAGLLYFLSVTGQGDDEAAIRGHLRELWWHSVPHRGGLAFPGEQLVRLSMDLAAGTAGVLAAMDAVHRRIDHLLPLLGGRSPQTAASAC
ncbi:class III lanthionine synthetase LanKC [Streptomyces sp. SCA3-4]|uniref:class III lanthionine synthetase LanKC n=1 Tax=Streptomyces sichuanensis TaxID=2871810 RepID=UPI001CE2BBD3|nr:class III lanthionine synthetase LanKC [Streptomyces sichuanensis]MCA6092063.1 class III lanthionine synthetase LanKC [Streptomyces sichuanensis]